MANGDWLRPAAPVEPASSGRPQTEFELRPLSLGEVLDRTFALYRSRFWLFAGISMVSASVQTVAQAFSLMAIRRVASQIVPLTPASNHLVLLRSSLGIAPFTIHSIGAAQIASWALGLVFVLISAIIHAATALALTQVYLHRPTSVKAALSGVGQRWYRWIGIALWQAGSAAWVPLSVLLIAVLVTGFATRSGSTPLIVIGGALAVVALLGGFPIGVVLYLRNALAVPAAVTESLTMRAAMSRSKVLAAGSKGRIFVVLLIAACLYSVVGVLQSPAALLMMFVPNEEHYLARGLALLTTFVGHTVVAPVALIGLTLLYFDQRVRKEALDLEILLDNARGGRPDEGFGYQAGGVSPEGYAPLG